MRELFEKSSLKLPQKLADHLFLYRAYRSFSTGGRVGRIGPQLPTRPLFVFVESKGNGYT